MPRYLHLPGKSDQIIRANVPIELPFLKDLVGAVGIEIE
jgi:hypothetical protein